MIDPRARGRRNGTLHRTGHSPFGARGHAILRKAAEGRDDGMAVVLEPAEAGESG